MKTIVFLGSHKSGSSYEAIRAADGMGYYTVLLTDRPSYIDKRLEFPHAHSVRLCHLDDRDEIGGAIDRLVMERFDICAIVSFVDPHCLTASQMSGRYGLKGFSEAAVAAMLDKVKSRELLKRTPYSPFFHVSDNPALPLKAARELPLVLKSPLSSGSKDVYPARTAEEYRKVFLLLKKQYPSVPVLAEKYIDGPQVLIETLTAGGKTHIAAMVEQEVTFTGRFIITGYRMPAAPDDISPLGKAAKAIVRLFGMEDGPCHLELRQGRGGWVLIEANPRISGGAMNVLIQTAAGVDLAGETLKCALGLPFCVEPKCLRETYLQYITADEGGVLEKVTGKTAAQNSPGVERVYVKPKKGTVLSPPLSMGHRYAYVIATGASGEEAKANAKTAAEKIKFHLSPV
ncbi:MAG: ATP-grasp domain-containing protein [Oscillospiraceae bacterium]|nr:ATP-grasp domain-containing protein [Oscillospiraceae bacterium]